MVCELIPRRCNSGRCMVGRLTSAWNTKITLHQLFGINFWKCNVIIYIQNGFRINYVIIFCQMVLSHSCCWTVPHFQRGKCCSFLFCVGSVSFVLLPVLLLGSLFGINFRERTFVFGGLLCLVLFDGVLPRFFFYSVALGARNCVENFLFMSGLPFLGFVLSSLGFSYRRRVCSTFFLRDTDQVVTGHTPTFAPFGLVPFPFLSLPHVCHRPFWPCVPLFLVFSRGAILGPARFGVFGFSRNFVGLELARPLWGPFLGREAARPFALIPFCRFCFSPLSCLGCTHWEGPPRDLAEAGPGDLARPGRRDSQGSPSRAEGWSPPCLDRCFCLMFVLGSQGPPRRCCANGPFWAGVPFHTGRPPRSSHARFSPRLFSLSFFFVSRFLLALSWANRLTKSRLRRAMPLTTRLAFTQEEEEMLCVSIGSGVFVDVLRCFVV